MSLRRIGARTALVAAGVLVSVALMVAPSWAEKGGNSAKAKLCEPGAYPGVLLNQQVETFKNEGACTQYAAHGGKLAGVDAVAGPVAVGGDFTETCSGFGLPSAMSVGCGTVHGTDTVAKELGSAGPEVMWSTSVAETCELLGFAKISGLVVVLVTPSTDEISLEARFAPPIGC